MAFTKEQRAIAESAAMKAGWQYGEDLEGMSSWDVMITCLDADRMNPSCQKFLPATFTPEIYDEMVRQSTQGTAEEQADIQSMFTMFE